MTKYIVRDLLFFITTAVLWLVASDSSEAALQWAGGTTLGFCAHLAHEWSHLVGAAIGRSTYAAASRIYSPFLFGYNAADNTRAQFLLMSVCGFIATAVVIGAFIAILPLDTLRGTIALNVALFFAALTLFIELPIAIWVLCGKNIPRLAQLF